ncbi:hypothetical protein [Catenulispora subtropica]|uniref:Uncharacterized protein n=1 Tax=Catenulispora subtropica TaxID=450798 RepID=A0ABN2T3W1_9ACTN
MPHPRTTSRGGGRPTRRPRAFPAVLAVCFLAGAALVAAPAGATVDPGQKWVADAIKEQLARKPGGVVSGNTIRYAKEDVTLTYRPATAPGGVVPDDYAGCSTGEVCLYTTSDVVASGVRLSTGSLWCPWENTNDLLDLRNYGLANQIRAADNESAWWAEGIWSRLGVRGQQWKMDPYGILFNLSPTNITYLNVCLKSNDLEY